MNGIEKKAARRSLAPLAALVLTAAAAVFWQTPARSAEDAVVIPPPVLDEKSASGTEKAIFAGGCFWGVQG
ncbi:MAG: peptide-methionine (S)-S-oxide reductase, partial [Mesorhizobium sp.]